MTLDVPSSAGRWPVLDPVKTRTAYDIVVSIINYNTPGLLISCLESLVREGSTLRKKIVVVDNASNPPIRPSDLANFSDVTLLSNAKNVGFGRANNQVFRAWAGEVYLVTNPDVRVSPGSFSTMWERLRARPELGALGVRLRYPNGLLQSSARRFPTLRSVLIRGLLSEDKAARTGIIRRYMMADAALNVVQPVDWVLGSCLFIKREAVQALAGFDEGFFMYYEDIDFCYRLWSAGWQVEYHPDIEWEHDYRRESAKSASLKLRTIHFWSALRFLGKHLGKRGVRASV